MDHQNEIQHGPNYRSVRWNAFRNFTKHCTSAIIAKS